MDNPVLISIISMVGLGFFFALILAVVDRKLRVESDPRIAEIEESLPGVNCGACGFSGCHAFAQAAVENEPFVETCPIGGTGLYEKVAGLLGISPKELQRKTAVVHCGARDFQRKHEAEYEGVRSCRAADILMGGGMACDYGCLGFGD